MVERTRLQLQTAWVEVLGPGSQRDLGNVIEVLWAFNACKSWGLCSHAHLPGQVEGTPVSHTPDNQQWPEMRQPWPGSSGLLAAVTSHIHSHFIDSTSLSPTSRDTANVTSHVSANSITNGEMAGWMFL